MEPIDDSSEDGDVVPGYDAADSTGVDDDSDNASVDDSDVEDGSMMPGETTLPWDGTSGAATALSTAARFAGLSIGGPRGIQVGQGVPNLGTSPTVTLRSQSKARASAILHAISANIGKHIALHAVAALVGKWGLPMVAAALGVGAEDLLFLVAQYAVKGRGRGRRGPHLNTVLKRIKKADHYRHMLAKYAHKAGIHQHHQPRAAKVVYAFQKRRRRK